MKHRREWVLFRVAGLTAYAMFLPGMASQAVESPQRGQPGDKPANPLTAKSVSDLQKIVATDVDAEHRFAAVDAPAAQGQQVLPQLNAALQDPTAYVRYRAAQALIPPMTQDRHSALWFQAAAKILEQAEKYPDLQQALAVAYGDWLQKGGAWTAPFAARGKFGYGIRGLERLMKEGTAIPPEVGRIVQILKSVDRLLRAGWYHAAYEDANPSHD